MTFTNIVWNELKARPWSALTSSLAILLGVAAFVAIRHVTVSSEHAVSEQLSTLGANILVLPKNADLQDYYSADQNGQTLPEELVSEIFLAGLTGVEKVSPKLNCPAKIGDNQFVLTGILPQSELKAQASWQTVSMFTAKAHDGCKKANLNTGKGDTTPNSLVTTRSIEKLESDEVVLGADLARKLERSPGDQIEIHGFQFTVLGTLSRTGTIDDSRVFAHLHTVQQISKSGEVVNAIEIVGCCEDAAGDLVPQLGKILPDTRIVTISQVVQTQVGVNRMMAKTSWIVLAILAVVGGISLSSAIAANVRDRRKEIGTLMALGATPRFVRFLFLVKALILGITAGVTGAFLGLISALVAGPHWADVSVSPLPGTVGLSILAATVLALLAAFLPARNASLFDPCRCFQES